MARILDPSEFPEEGEFLRYRIPASWWGIRWWLLGVIPRPMDGWLHATTRRLAFVPKLTLGRAVAGRVAWQVPLDDVDGIDREMSWSGAPRVRIRIRNGRSPRLESFAITSLTREETATPREVDGWIYSTMLLVQYEDRRVAPEEKREAPGHSLLGLEGE